MSIWRKRQEWQDPELEALVEQARAEMSQPTRSPLARPKRARLRERRTRDDSPEFVHEIDTPAEDDETRWMDYESRLYHGMPAGVPSRIGAAVLDLFVLAPAGAFIVCNLLWIKSVFLHAAICVPLFLYKPLFESVFGATVGKALLGLRVEDENGRRLTFGQAMVRGLPALLLAALLAAQGILMLQNPMMQRMDALEDLQALYMFAPLYKVALFIAAFALVDGLWAVPSPRKLALHDILAASCCVFRVRSPEPPRETSATPALQPPLSSGP